MFRLCFSRFPALLLACSLLYSSTLWATEKMYMFPVESRNVAPEDLSRVNDLVTKRIAAYKAIDIVTESTVRKILETSKVDMALRTDCLGDSACTRDLSALINSRYFLRINLLGLKQSGLISTAEIVDASAGKILAKVDWQMETPVEQSNADLDAALDKLFAPLKLKGEVQVFPENPASTLTIDGHAVQLRSKGKTRYSLLVGSHQFSLTHPDYIPSETSLFVSAGVQQWQPDQITLQEAQTPLYNTWWFWTIVGAVVAGGATAAWFLTRPVQADVPQAEKPRASTIELRF